MDFVIDNNLNKFDNEGITRHGKIAPQIITKAIQPSLQTKPQQKPTATATTTTSIP